MFRTGSLPSTISTARGDLPKMCIRDRLKTCTEDSFLEELDDYNIEVIYKRLAANSVAFMLLTRCGLDTVSYTHLLETDEAYGVGKNGEIFDVTFGLYAAEELAAADGEVIPADGLIEIISLDENGKGKVSSDLPLGSYLSLIHI